VSIKKTIRNVKHKQYPEEVSPEMWEFWNWKER
jgi:hypothetical protein